MLSTLFKLSISDRSRFKNNNFPRFYRYLRFINQFLLLPLSVFHIGTKIHIFYDYYPYSCETILSVFTVYFFGSHLLVYLLSLKCLRLCRYFPVATGQSVVLNHLFFSALLPLAYFSSLFLM